MNIIDTATGARLISLGAVVAYPTEACFGIGCDPTNSIAIDRVIRIKKRPHQKGLIVIADRIESLLPYLSVSHESVLDEPLSTWPGPYTWIFPASPWALNFKCVADGKIAVRITAHRTAAQICKLFGGAIVSTSANFHGQAPIRSYGLVARCLGRQLDFVVRGSLGNQHRPTQIRDAASGKLIRAA